MKATVRSPEVVKEDKLYAGRLFTFRTIDSLSPAQAAKALTVPASRENVTYAPDALQYILEQSQGYPYFLRPWVWQPQLLRARLHSSPVCGLHRADSPVRRRTAPPSRTPPG